MDELNGDFYVRFINGNEARVIRVDHGISDREGHLLYLVGEDGTIYNWFTIISMKKMS